MIGSSDEEDSRGGSRLPGSHTLSPRSDDSNRLPGKRRDPAISLPAGEVVDVTDALTPPLLDEPSQSEGSESHTMWDTAGTFQDKQKNPLIGNDSALTPMFDTPMAITPALNGINPAQEDILSEEKYLDMEDSFSEEPLKRRSDAVKIDYDSNLNTMSKLVVAGTENTPSAQIELADMGKAGSTTVTVEDTQTQEPPPKKKKKKKKMEEETNSTSNSSSSCSCCRKIGHLVWRALNYFCFILIIIGVMGVLPIVLWLIDHEEGRFFFLGIVSTIFPAFVIIVVCAYKFCDNDCPISGIASWFAVIFITNILTFLAFAAINASEYKDIFTASVLVWHPISWLCVCSCLTCNRAPAKGGTFENIQNGQFVRGMGQLCCIQWLFPDAGDVYNTEELETRV